MQNQSFSSVPVFQFPLPSPQVSATHHSVTQIYDSCVFHSFSCTSPCLEHPTWYPSPPSVSSAGASPSGSLLSAGPCGFQAPHTFLIPVRLSSEGKGGREQGQYALLPGARRMGAQHCRPVGSKERPPKARGTKAQGSSEGGVAGRGQSRKAG